MIGRIHDAALGAALAVHRVRCGQAVGAKSPTTIGTTTKHPIRTNGCIRSRNAEIPGEYSSEIDAVAELTYRHTMSTVPRATCAAPSNTR